MNEIIKTCYLAFLELNGKTSHWFDAAVKTGAMSNALSVRLELEAWHSIKNDFPIKNQDNIHSANDIIVTYAVDSRTIPKRKQDILNKRFK